MKKLFLLLFVLAINVISLQAKPIDRNIALTAAQKFATVQFSMERAAPQLEYTGQNEAYYVFNLNDHSFVIIAGDDAHRPVIGYSDESAFDASNIPPALSYYLDGVTECMLQLHGIRLIRTIIAAPKTRLDRAVMPSWVVLPQPCRN